MSDCLPQLQVLAAVTAERLPLFPDVPTVGELAPELNIALWNGLFVPKGTPQDVIAKIEAAALAGIKSGDALGYVDALGAPLYWQDSAAAAAQIKADKQTMQGLSQ